MHWGKLKEKWNQLGRSVKQRWRQLTGENWNVAAEKRDQLIGRVQTWYGISKKEAEKYLNGWSQTRQH